MKRHIKLLTVLLAVALVTGVVIFYACEKEKIINPIEGTHVTGTHHEATVETKDYDAYIEELMTSTGIDIYKLSELEEVKKMADKQLQMTSALTAISQTKGELTEEKLTQLESLRNAINVAYTNGNEYEALRLFESFCAICRTIDGFIFNVNEYGLQTFTYAPDKEPLSLPITQMEAEKVNAIALFEEVNNNPQFSSLQETAKMEILTAAIYLNMKNNVPKDYSVSDCKRAAWEDYAFALAGATLGLEFALHLCIGTGPAAVACVGGAFACYGVAVAWATWGYKRALRRC